jgi:hypothetical protein
MSEGWRVGQRSFNANTDVSNEVRQIMSDETVSSRTSVWLHPVLGSTYSTMTFRKEIWKKDPTAHCDGMCDDLSHSDGIIHSDDFKN